MKQDEKKYPRIFLSDMTDSDSVP